LIINKKQVCGSQTAYRHTRHNHYMHHVHGHETEE